MLVTYPGFLYWLSDAAVLRIDSKVHGAFETHRVIVKAGKIAFTGLADPRLLPGTTVLVKDWLCTMPVRRKQFQKEGYALAQKLLLL